MVLARLRSMPLTAYAALPAADAVDASWSHSGHHLALAGQRGRRHAPPVARGDDPMEVGNPDLGEPYLVEVNLAADVAKGPHLYPGRRQVDQEVGDAAALGDGGIGAGQADGELGLSPAGVCMLDVCLKSPTKNRSGRRCSWGQMRCAI